MIDQRPRERQRERCQQQAAHQHQEELLDLESTGRLLLRTSNELKRRKADDLSPPTVDQMDDRGDGGRQETNQERRREKTQDWPRPSTCISVFSIGVEVTTRW